MDNDRSRQAVIALLEKRSDEATVCPSEVAKSVAGADGVPDWRDLTPSIHAAVDDLLTDGVVRLSWKGKALDRRTGPYRIRWRRK
jgi:hypothetical protein